MNAFLTTSTNVDFSAITNALTGSFSAGQIGAIIAAILGSTVGIAVLWWGARKLVNAVIDAFKTGKIHF